jgi:hypothetical protein
MGMVVDIPDPDRRRTTVNEMTFAGWMKTVNDWVWTLVRVSVHDLPDAPFRTWYDDGLSAKEAAGRAIKETFQ